VFGLPGSSTDICIRGGEYFGCFGEFCRMLVRNEMPPSSFRRAVRKAQCRAAIGDSLEQFGNPFAHGSSVELKLREVITPGGP
jgi:hypothetical protein